MRLEFYWLHMASDAYAVVKDCQDCNRNRTQSKKARHLKFFLAIELLELIATDIFGHLPKTRAGNQFIILMVDHYSKLTRGVPSTSTTAPNVGSILYDRWVIFYGISAYLLTDNRRQFVTKSFENLCKLLGLKHLTTKAYYL